MADLIYTYVNPVSQKDIEKVVGILQNDGVIAYPTDVNWALGCDATRPKALDRM